MPIGSDPFSQAFSPAFGDGTIGFMAPIVPMPIGNPVHGVAVTKSDATIYTPPLQMLRVGGAGDVAVILVGDTVPVTLSAVRDGTILNVCVNRVMSTNTTATFITGLY